LLLALSVAAQSPTDISLKARVTLAVARFAELPTTAAGGLLRLCVAHRQDAVMQAFRQLSGQRAGERNVEVVEAVGGECDVLFVHSSAGLELGNVPGSQRALLTIGDTPGFLAHGGMIELLIVNDALRFDVNITAARQRGVRFPAQVLKLARRVAD
jgi:hypothetical protein